MLNVFGLSLPAAAPLGRDEANLLAERIGAAAASVQQGAKAAVSASVRRDAQQYLDARRAGQLRFAPGAGRACDAGAWALMRLTVDAPAVLPAATLLVA
ncbi:hypothetical protein [Roseisolibacter agri]|uniref:Uncharacterized protein n=1 Tax=Roseisolibacter agri TaxID=2014610 RepID=A0AA37QDL3_9BACT|nr:hypothetical protein [Roseisolibacter agri]GLC28382.1 hypothetical protein rosag_48950 [Roseisolibacter agri]